MKTTPTDLDREAALFFRAVPGVRCLASCDGGTRMWSRVVEDTIGGHTVRTENGAAFPAYQATIHALDVEDPATVGVMIAQLQEERPNREVSLVDRLHELPEALDRRFIALVGHEGAFAGPTRGFALVAARRR